MLKVKHVLRCFFLALQNKIKEKEVFWEKKAGKDEIFKSLK